MQKTASIREGSWRHRRLKSELRTLQQDPPEGILATPLDEKCSFWQAMITGPKGTPYEGGKFYLYLQIPQRFAHFVSNTAQIRSSRSLFTYKHLLHRIKASFLLQNCQIEFGQILILCIVSLSHQSSDRFEIKIFRDYHQKSIYTYNLFCIVTYRIYITNHRSSVSLSLHF